MEPIIQVVTADGTLIPAAIQVEEDTTYLLKPEKHDCLTCGREFESDEAVEVQRVDCLEGLRGWLADRQHLVEADHHVILCESCLTEAEDELDLS